MKKIILSMMAATILILGAIFSIPQKSEATDPHFLFTPTPTPSITATKTPSKTPTATVSATPTATPKQTWTNAWIDSNGNTVKATDLPFFTNLFAGVLQIANGFNILPTDPTGGNNCYNMSVTNGNGILISTNNDSGSHARIGCLADGTVDIGSDSGTTNFHYVHCVFNPADAPTGTTALQGLQGGTLPPYIIGYNYCQAVTQWASTMYEVGATPTPGFSGSVTASAGVTLHFSGGIITGIN